MKRFNNKILVVILAVLVVAFILTRVFRSPSRERNIDTKAFTVDTTRIDKIIIKPVADNNNAIELIRNGKEWHVARGDIKTKTNADLVNNLMRSLADLKPERIITRKQEKWEDYELTDSTSTEVVAYSGSDEIIRLRVGKEMMGATYMRKNNEDEVYAIDGFHASSFSQKFNDWRDPSFADIDKTKITKLTFTYPADSGFVISKKDHTWMIDNEHADSAKVVQYLDQIVQREITTFADDFAADKQPDVIISMEGLSKPFLIKGWKTSFAEWVLTSDQQPNVYFSDPGSLIAREIFPGRSKFVSTLRK